MLYLRQKCNLCGHVLEYKEMHIFFIAYVTWVAYTISIIKSKKNAP